MAAAGAGGGVPPPNMRESLREFGKNSPLRNNVKQRFFSMAKTPKYAEEETSTVKYLPIKLVDDVIASQNLVEIFELLTLARFLEKKLLETGLNDFEEVKIFLAMDTDLDSIKKQRKKFNRNKKSWEWQQHYKTVIPAGEYINYKPSGNAKPSKTEIIQGANGPERVRIIPDYEWLGRSGHYNQNKSKMHIFQDEGYFNELRRRQNLLVSYMVSHDPLMFDTDLLIGFVRHEVIDEIINLKNFYTYLHVIIGRLEREMVGLMDFAVKTGRVDQIEALERIRLTNLEDLADKYDVDMAALQSIHSRVKLIRSPDRTEEEANELRSTVLPKILSNLDHLRRMKQNAKTSKGGRRNRRINKTKRR